MATSPPRVGERLSLAQQLAKGLGRLRQSSYLTRIEAVLLPYALNRRMGQQPTKLSIYCEITTLATDLAMGRTERCSGVADPELGRWG
jgi:hypothetical protein